MLQLTQVSLTPQPARFMAARIRTTLGLAAIIYKSPADSPERSDILQAKAFLNPSKEPVEFSLEIRHRHGRNFRRCEPPPPLIPPLVAARLFARLPPAPLNPRRRFDDCRCAQFALRL
jgi:hypothetical protein